MTSKDSPTAVTWFEFLKMIQGMTLRRAEIEQLIFQLKSEFWMIFFYWHQRAELTRDGVTSGSATLCG